MWIKRDGGYEPMVTDMYVVDNPGDYGQSVILRSDSDWEGSYWSQGIGSLMRLYNMGSPWSNAVDVLLAIGKLIWRRQS